MLDDVSKSSRRSAKPIKPQQDSRAVGQASPPGSVEQIARLSAAKVLERISQVRLQRDELDAEMTLLIDHAVNLGIRWPDIARRLGVSRQAARQHYLRRHSASAHRRDRVA